MTSDSRNNNNRKNSGSNNDLYKICVLGDGGVGKTSLTIQYISNHFVESYDPTIEDSYRRQVVIDEKPCVLDILDTAGQEELSAMQSQWILSCCAFIIVYSVTNRMSFDQVQILKEKITRTLDSDNVPIMLVGNKCDLESQREVTKDEGQDLAKCMKMLHIEASSKTRLNVEESFIELVRHIRRSEEAAKKPPKSGHSAGDKFKTMMKSTKNKFNKIKNEKLHSVCKLM